MNGLYKNIGDKVCKVAIFCGWLGVISIVIGLICLLLWLDGDDVFMILGGAAICSGVLSIISSWPLYAFGQITNDVHAMRESGVNAGAAKQEDELPDL